MKKIQFQHYFENLQKIFSISFKMTLLDKINLSVYTIYNRGSKYMKKIQSKKSVILGEILNAVTHGLGVGLSIAGLIVLILKALNIQNQIAIISFTIYGSSMILLFLASTLYHSLKFTKLGKIMQRIDHSSIYALIAGTYTPFCLLGIKGSLGIAVCIFVWIFSIIGTVLEILFLNKMAKISVFLYLAIGWVAIFTIKPLYDTIGWNGLLFILLGGASYSIGTIFYSKKHNNLYHVIWHLFVLLGSFFMYIPVFLYL